MKCGLQSCMHAETELYESMRNRYTIGCGLLFTASAMPLFNHYKRRFRHGVYDRSVGYTIVCMHRRLSKEKHIPTQMPTQLSGDHRHSSGFHLGDGGGWLPPSLGAHSPSLAIP